MAAFLTEHEETPFVHGQSDCCMFAADWVWRVNGTDPAADLRGTYGTALGAQKVMRGQGGLKSIMERAGWARTHSASDGDIGIVGSKPLVPAVYYQGKWWIKTSPGVGFVTDPVLGPCWAMPEGGS